MARRRHVSPARSPWVSLPEAAAETGYSAKTLRRWCRLGLIPSPHFRRDPGGYFLTRVWVARLVFVGLPLVVGVRDAGG